MYKLVIDDYRDNRNRRYIRLFQAEQDMLESCREFLSRLGPLYRVERRGHKFKVYLTNTYYLYLRVSLCYPKGE